MTAQLVDRGHKKLAHLSKEDLTVRRASLLELMQTINFGRIERLAVLKGDPVLDPPPRVIREVKFGGANGARPELNADGFLLKKQHIEMFQQLDQLGTGTIEVLEIQHGLPFRMHIGEATA